MTESLQDAVCMIQRSDDRSHTTAGSEMKSNNHHQSRQQTRRRSTRRYLQRHTASGGVAAAGGRCGPPTRRGPTRWPAAAATSRSTTTPATTWCPSLLLPEDLPSRNFDSLAPEVLKALRVHPCLMAGRGGGGGGHSTACSWTTPSPTLPASTRGVRRPHLLPSPARFPPRGLHSWLEEGG